MMTKIIFEDKIDSLSYKQVLELCNDYIGMNTKIVTDGYCDDDNIKWELYKRDNFIEDFKSMLKGEVMMKDFYLDWWDKDYQELEDGVCERQVQNIFMIYEYLNELGSTIDCIEAK